MTMIRSVSVVVPTFNEAAAIRISLARILKFLTTHDISHQVIVSDDGSRDGTPELVAREFQDKVLVIRGEHAGKGAAVRAGVAIANREWVLVCDADLSVPIELLLEFANPAQQVPIVIGSKHVPGRGAAYPRLRWFASRIGQALIGILAVQGFHDTQCGFKLIRTDVARQLFAIQKLDGFGYDFEILHLARRWGISVSEVPVQCMHRVGGSVHIWAYLKTLGEAFTVAGHRVLGTYPSRPPLAVSELTV